MRSADLHHVRRRSGQPLLLIHGLGSSWRSRELILPALETEREVIAVDLQAKPSSSPTNCRAGASDAYKHFEDVIRLGGSLPRARRLTNSPPRPPCPPPSIKGDWLSKDANIAAQEHLAENINAGNVAAAVETFAEDAIDHDPAPGQGAGRAGFKTFFTALVTAFPDAHIEPAHLVADDEHVAIAYTLTGTHNGDFNGLAPTGRKIEVRGVQIGRFENGKIVERWGSSDELGILKQLGVNPTAG